MELNKKHIFEPSGCLSRDAFLTFLEGNLQGEEMQLAEKHVASCPFCSEAVEGFSMISPDRKAFLADLDKTFAADFKIATKNQWGRRILWYSIAASVLIMIGFVTLYKIQPKNQLAENILPMSDSLKRTTIIDIEKKSPIIKPKGFDNRITSTVKKDKAVSTDDMVYRSDNEKDQADKLGILSVESSSKRAEELSMTMKAEESKSVQVKGAAYSLAVSADVQELEPIEIVVPENIDGKVEPVFMYVEEKATFQGGDLHKFQRYILENFKISESVKSSGVSGKVIAQFVVGLDGKVENIKIIKGLNFGADNEMVRVLQSSPPWKPAKQGGKAVRQRFILPLSIDIKTED